MEARLPLKPAGQGAGTTYGVPGAVPWKGLWSQCLRGKSPLKVKFKGSADSARPIECTATRWQRRLQADGGEQPFPPAEDQMEEQCSLTPGPSAGESLREHVQVCVCACVRLRGTDRHTAGQTTGV